MNRAAFQEFDIIKKVQCSDTLCCDFASPVLFKKHHISNVNIIEIQQFT